MSLNVETTDLDGVRVLTPERHGDGRGFFSETWNRRAFEACGVAADFVQDNHAHSPHEGTLRGFHFQIAPHAQGKLVRVSRGAMLDVIVDVRVGASTFGHWAKFKLTAQNGRTLWIPPGYAHAYVTLKPDTDVLYKTTDYYAPECERGLAFDDPALGVDWPIALERLRVTERDRSWPTLADLAAQG